MIIEFQDIVWDTEGEEVSLPTAVTYEQPYPNGYILTEGDVEYLMDKISQQFGWAIDSANYVCHDSD